MQLFYNDIININRYQIYLLICLGVITLKLLKEFLLVATIIHFMLLVSIYLQFSVNCIICEMFNDTLDQIRCIRLTYVVFNVMASHLSLYL